MFSNLIHFFKTPSKNNSKRPVREHSIYFLFWLSDGIGHAAAFTSHRSGVVSSFINFFPSCSRMAHLAQMGIPVNGKDKELVHAFRIDGEYFHALKLQLTDEEYERLAHARSVFKKEVDDSSVLFTVKKVPLLTRFFTNVYPSYMRAIEDRVDIQHEDELEARPRVTYNCASSLIKLCQMADLKTFLDIRTLFPHDLYRVLSRKEDIVKPSLQEVREKLNGIYVKGMSMRGVHISSQLEGPDEWMVSEYKRNRQHENMMDFSGR